MKKTLRALALVLALLMLPALAPIELPAPAATVAKAEANEFNRKKPVTGSKKRVYVSAKRIWYEGDCLMTELFIYNKTGKSVLGNASMTVEVKNKQGDALATYMFGAWLPAKGKLKNGKTAILKLALPLVEAVSALDLASKNYDITVHYGGFVKGKAILAKVISVQAD